jgi:hypothetical protein
MKSLSLALLLVPSLALAQGNRLSEGWQDIGEATFESDTQPAPAKGAAPAPGGGEAPGAMGIASASVSAGLLAFAGTSLGVALAFTHGALWSLLPSAPGNFGAISLPIWIGFWTLPALGAATGAAAGAAGLVPPAGVAATAGAALGGAGLGALLGWGIGAGSATLFSPPVPFRFPSDNPWSFITATGILLGAGVGAAAGAAVTAPFFMPGVLEGLRE